MVIIIKTLLFNNIAIFSAPLSPSSLAPNPIHSNVGLLLRALASSQAPSGPIVFWPNPIHNKVRLTCKPSPRKWAPWNGNIDLHNGLSFIYMDKYWWLMGYIKNLLDVLWWAMDIYTFMNMANGHIY